MPKTKKYSFSDKKIILQSLNNGLINGYLKKEFIYKFDKIFNYISDHEESEQKLYFDGQIYDAFSLLASLISQANKILFFLLTFSPE